MGKRLPGSGGTQASIFCAKEHHKGIKLQNTPSDGVEHREGEVEAQGTGGEEEHNAATPDRQGTWTLVKAGRGGGAGVRFMKAGRWRKGPLDSITLLRRTA